MRLVIRSFKDKALERFFATGDGRRLGARNMRRIANILRAPGAVSLAIATDFPP